MWRATAHLSSDSRNIDGGRLYWKKSTIFMWKKPRGNNVTVHTFYLAEWIDGATRVEALNALDNRSVGI